MESYIYLVSDQWSLVFYLYFPCNLCIFTIGQKSCKNKSCIIFQKLTINRCCADWYNSPATGHKSALNFLNCFLSAGSRLLFIIFTSSLRVKAQKLFDLILHSTEATVRPMQIKSSPHEPLPSLRTILEHISAAWAATGPDCS